MKTIPVSMGLAGVKDIPYFTYDANYQKRLDHRGDPVSIPPDIVTVGLFKRRDYDGTPYIYGLKCVPWEGIVGGHGYKHDEPVGPLMSAYTDGAPQEAIALQGMDCVALDLDLDEQVRRGLMDCDVIDFSGKSYGPPKYIEVFVASVPDWDVFYDYDEILAESRSKINPEWLESLESER